MVACSEDGGYDRARRKGVGGGIRRVSQRAQSRKRSMHLQQAAGASQQLYLGAIYACLHDQDHVDVDNFDNQTLSTLVQDGLPRLPLQGRDAGH
jgi:hypothetical protein